MELSCSRRVPFSVQYAHLTFPWSFFKKHSMAVATSNRPLISDLSLRTGMRYALLARDGRVHPGSP